MAERATVHREQTTQMNGKLVDFSLWSGVDSITGKTDRKTDIVCLSVCLVSYRINT